MTGISASVVMVALVHRGHATQPGSVHLYDLEQDSSDALGDSDLSRGDEDNQAMVGSGSDHNNGSMITCNSTPMVRERLSG